jgi:hypothetical protein
MSTNDQRIDYKTHILIGVRGSGAMAVIADWPYVPPQIDVQTHIDGTREPYVTFLLCTPTSILPAEHSALSTPPRFGPPTPVRRR